MGTIGHERTHPWIDFRLDLSRMTAQTWMDLGECRSKIAHLAGTPLDPRIAAEMHTVSLTKGAQATTAIEGNTLSEEEVRAIVDAASKLPPSLEYLEREVQNILEAFTVVDRLVRTSEGPVAITPNLLRSLNGIVLHDLDVDERVRPGEFRDHTVVVGNADRAPDPRHVPELVDGLCAWLSSPEFNDPPGGHAWDAPMAILRAVVAHIYIAWIHPFGDGNGRTARLVEFLILLDGGFPTPAAHLLTSHYNRTRSKYALELAAASRRRNLLPFISYAVQGLVDQLQEQIDLVRSQQFEDRWEQFVHQRFSGSNTQADTRRRRLALAVGRSSDSVPVSSVRRLTPDLAEAYFGKTGKTVTRDVNALVKLDLVERSGHRIRARKEVIEAFLPLRKAPRGHPSV